MADLIEASESGVRLDSLVALRDLLARNIAACESMRDLASLSGRFQSVLGEIAMIEARQPKGDGIDEIAARRAARRGGSTAGSSRAKQSV